MTRQPSPAEREEKPAPKARHGRKWQFPPKQRPGKGSLYVHLVGSSFLRYHFLGWCKEKPEETLPLYIYIYLCVCNISNPKMQQTQTCTKGALRRDTLFGARDTETRKAFKPLQEVQCLPYRLGPLAITRTAIAVSAKIGIACLPLFIEALPKRSNPLSRPGGGNETGFSGNGSQEE